MTANVGILTEREFKMIDGVEEETYSSWREAGIFMPLLPLDDSHPLFFQNHVDFYFQLKSLNEQGYTIEQIRNAMVNERIDMDELQRLNPAARYVGLSRRELYDLVREMQVRYAGSMSKEQLYICLTEPQRINEMILQVRPNAVIIEPTDSVNENEPDISTNEDVEPNEVESTVETNTSTEVLETISEEVSGHEEIAELAQYESMHHSALASLAREQNIRYSRQMTKTQLISCLMHPEQREQIVEQVRQEARNRRLQNESQIPNEVVPEERPRRVRISRLMGVAERPATNLEVTVLQEQPVPEVLEVDENIASEQLAMNIPLEVDSVSGTEEVQNTEPVENDTEEDIQPVITVLPNGTSVIVQMTPFTTYTRDVLQRMGTKDIASLVRDARLFPYFRRMNKPELIDALMNPQTRTTYVITAWERYQLYVNQ